MGVGLPFERKGIKDFVEVAAALPEYQFIWFGELNPLLVPSDINKIIENDLLSEEGLIITEWDFSIGCPDFPKQVSVIKERKYGRVGISVLKKATID